MDERRARILDDLRGQIDGELLFEPVERAPYALDASLYEIDPLGVVVPRHEDDLLALVHYAQEQSIPLHPRGAGTSMAGETLGSGLVVDFSRHFRRIVSTGPASVVVQPGVVLDVVNDHLAQFGRRLGPDPSGPESRTIGGMIGANSAGARSLRYGATADHVATLEVMFAGGDRRGSPASRRRTSIMSRTISRAPSPARSRRSSVTTRRPSPGTGPGRRGIARATR